MCHVTYGWRLKAQKESQAISCKNLFVSSCIFSRFFPSCPESFRVYPSLFVFTRVFPFFVFVSFCEIWRLFQSFCVFHEFLRHFGSFSVYSNSRVLSSFRSRPGPRVLTGARQECVTFWHTSFIHIYEWGISHMDEPRHRWMSRVTYERAMSQMNESCHIWTSHVTDEWVMSHMNEPCHTEVCRAHVKKVSQLDTTHSYEWVLSSVGSHMNVRLPARKECESRRAHLTWAHMKELCQVSVHIWMRDQRHKNNRESIRAHLTCDWVMSRMNESCHRWMSHVTYERVMSRMNEPCHVWMSHVTYEWVMSRINESCHVWMSHVTDEGVMSHMNESCHV